MQLSTLLGLALGVTAGFAVQVPHEKRNQLTSRYGWSEPPIEDRSSVVRATIGLKQRNLEDAYKHVADVSHPDSPNYGKFWTRKDVEDMFSPSAESTNTVMNWLSHAGIKSAKESSNRGWIAFDASIQQLDDILNTTFYRYSDERTGESTYACSQYSLPPYVAPHVDYVLPGVNPMSPLKKRKHPSTKRDDIAAPIPGPAKGPVVPQQLHVPASASYLPPDLQNCGYNITPPCLRALYDLPKPTSALADGELGIYEQGEYSQEDMDQFFAKYASNVPNSTHPYLVSINGATAPGPQMQADAEADLDFQIAYGLLGASNVTLYQAQTPDNYTGQDPLMNDLLTAIDGSFCDEDERKAGFMCGGDFLTNVLSVSMESPELFSQSAAYQQRACNEFMKLGLQGKTIIFSSGDYGVGSNPLFGEPFCLDNGCAPQDLQQDPLHNTVNNGTIFMPGFPSNCPYVLSVGGTMVDSNRTVRDPETALNLPKNGLASCDPYVTFSSSGGFANYFDRPDYQKTAIDGYYSKFNLSYPSYDSNKIDVSDNSTNIGKNGGVYNRIGRGFPDVSANGAHFMSFNMGEDKPTDGTSVSAPIWGSIIAMINARRAEAGKGPVGFINTVLYEHPEVFHDIVGGNNAGCGTDGFEAVEGWDPITGLGTPDYPALEKLFLSLP